MDKQDYPFDNRRPYYEENMFTRDKFPMEHQSTVNHSYQIQSPAYPENNWQPNDGYSKKNDYSFSLPVPSQVQARYFPSERDYNNMYGPKQFPEPPLSFHQIQPNALPMDDHYQAPYNINPYSNVPAPATVPSQYRLGGRFVPVQGYNPAPPVSLAEQYRGTKSSFGSGGSNAQGRAINKLLLDTLRDRVVDPQRLDMVIESYVERMDCVNLATLLFHTGKKRIALLPIYVKRIADRLNNLKEELRAREASNALYGLKCLSSEVPEVRELIYALANKIAATNSDFVAQAVGNALYGCQMMSSEYEEVRYLLLVLSTKVSRCTELLEAQNVGNALYGLRGMNSDYKEVRAIIQALTPKVATAREELNGQALGNSLYGLQCMNSKEIEVKQLLTVLATKVSRTWEDLKAQEVGNALYGLKRMSTDIPEVRALVAALVPKIASSPDVLDAQAIGNSLYGLQNMKSDNREVLALLGVLADKIAISCAELDGQAMGNSLYGLQGMSSDFPETRAVLSALTVKIQSSCLEMNAQELGNALYGMHNMSSSYIEVRRIISALAAKVGTSKHELTSQEIGNALFGLQNMSSEHVEVRKLVGQLSIKIQQSHTILDPQGVSNSLFGLQRLSSESKEVRDLIHALSFKVEHCWKLLGAHHVAQACFGLQNLSSEDPEVLYLIKVFVHKISACREEMSAKQLSYSLFGLQKMSGKHLEVLALLTSITEKINMSADVWNANHFSMALFGLQGIDSNVEEMRLVLNVLCHKASLCSLKDIEPHMLGNSFYGMQRMSTSNPEVVKLISVLMNPFINVMHYPEKISPLVVANLIFGLQGCSCKIETVHKMFEVIGNVVNMNIEAAYALVQRRELTPDIFMEVVALYQACVLVIFNHGDLHEFEDLRVVWLDIIRHLEPIVEENKTLYSPRPLTFAEVNAASEIRNILTREPYTINTGAFLGGFEFSIFIHLNPNLELRTSRGENYNPKLVIDLIGSSHRFPDKELFGILRDNVFEKEKMLPVRTVPAEAFDISNGNGFRKYINILTALQPSPEDAATIAQQLNTKSASSMGLMTSVRVDDTQSILLNISGSSPKFHHRVFGGIQSNVNDQRPGQYPYNQRANGMEYIDDEISKISPEVSSDARYSNLIYYRKPLGMLLGWLGEWPKVLTLQTFHALGGHFVRFPTAYPTNTAPEQRKSFNSDVSVGSKVSSSGRAISQALTDSIDQYDVRYTSRPNSNEINRNSRSSDSTLEAGHMAQRSRRQNKEEKEDSDDSVNSTGRTLTAKLFDPHGIPVLNNPHSRSDSSLINYFNHTNYQSSSVLGGFHNSSDTTVSLNNMAASQSEDVRASYLIRDFNFDAEKRQSSSLMKSSMNIEVSEITKTQSQEFPSPLSDVEYLNIVPKSVKVQIEGQDEEEIELLQAQIEIMKLQQKVKMLKNRKMGATNLERNSREQSFDENETQVWSNESINILEKQDTENNI